MLIENIFGKIKFLYLDGLNWEQSATAGLYPKGLELPPGNRHEETGRRGVQKKFFLIKIFSLNIIPKKYKHLLILLETSKIDYCQNILRIFHIFFRFCTKYIKELSEKTL